MSHISFAAHPHGSPNVRPHGARAACAPKRLIAASLGLLPALLVALLLAGAAHAEGTGEAAGPVEAFDDVVVVANRAPEPLSQVGSSVTVLSEAVIRDSQSTFVSDLLATTPGINVARNGGAGGLTSVFIRGADSDQTVVLVDGVQVNDPSAPGGDFDFGALLTGDAARIEILRGAQSTLYGSQAMGGVVSITTTPTAAPDTRLTVEAGSRSTALVSASTGATFGDLGVRLAGQHLQTAGISAFDQNLGGRERDGHHNNSLTGRLDYALGADWALDLRGYYSQSRTEYDGLVPPDYAFGDDREYGTYRQATGYAGLNGSTAGGVLKHRLALQYTDSDRRAYNPDLGAIDETFYGIGRNRRVEYQGTWAIGERSRLVFGAQDERAALSTDSPAYDVGPGLVRAAVVTRSAYAQLTTTQSGLTLTAGARRDHHETFGSHSTAQGAVAWAAGHDLVFRASLGQGFKAPALYQLFSPYGNTGLRPETATSWDAGVEFRPLAGRGLLGATYFHRDSENLITYIDCSKPDPRCLAQPLGYYENTARAVTRGVELQAGLTISSAWSVAANYTYADSRDRSSGAATEGRELFRRPPSFGNLSVTYCPDERLAATLAARFAGRTFDDPLNQIRLSPYVVVDLRASYNLTERYSVYGRLENLADRRYEVAYRYGTYGRGAFVGFGAKL